ncbi:hypothetical protein [Stenotrophomonas maltophilia]|uniref:hypothetical protein n=1 Tax=Stenotrophomonas maltophilia TaxID=40324 RepID=UPI0015F20F24|nr:hypothetical protein [Stenotrophomonas maltophilia]QDY48754.1 hypothetical protein DUW70_09520 [Stenotrophomonas maltophilia]
MSTDKTLAEAQPGGRVRLGDQAERARFEAWAEDRELSTAKCSADGMKGDYADLSTDWCWAAWQAALSAQPSPDRSFDLEAMLAVCVPGGDIADPQVIADNIRHWFAAQPSQGGQDALKALDHLVAFCSDDTETVDRLAGLIRTALTARQPSKQPDSVALGEATEFCIEKGGRQPAHGSGTLVDSGALQMALNVLRRAGKDEVADALESTATRQPVGEPVRTVKADDAPFGLTTAEKVAWARGANYAIKEYVAPPAQAVDLGQFRAKVAELLRREFDLEVADPEDHRHDDGSGEADRIAGKIVDLLDSQVVGK